MENLNEFLTTVVFPALLTIFTTVIGLVAAIGERRRGKKDKEEEEKETQQQKIDIVNVCVKAVEQMHKDVHGEEKFNLCVDGIKQMFESKGIEASDFEIKMLVEAALAEFNDAFKTNPLKSLVYDLDEGGSFTFSKTSEDPTEVDEID